MQPQILVVDDDAATRDALFRTLRKEFEVYLAESAVQALGVLQDHPDIKIILTDEKMPDRSGTDLLAEVRVLYPHMARIVMSGHLRIEDMVQAINRAEIHRVILKPWENEALLLQLHESVLIQQNLEEILRLQKLAITDPVTGLTNHRYFQEKLKEEFERAQRHERVFSLMMVDVDHFKKFNDRFGHPEGDKALAQIAHLLKSATRTSDSVSRYGGEEFAVILPETPKNAAVEVAERIRMDLENISVSGSKQSPHLITLSIGVSSFPRDGKTPAELLNSADFALYQAKEKGRNRVEVFL